MNRKTPECYMAVFRFIEKKLLKLEPFIVMTDYEDGLRKAVKKCWPNVSIRGCWWHYKRAVHKKCISFGMAKIFKKRAEAREIKRMLTNIPLLPEESVVEGYARVKEYARKKNMLESFRETFKYYEQYWLKQVCFIFHSFLQLILTC